MANTHLGGIESDVELLSEGAEPSPAEKKAPKDAPIEDDVALLEDETPVEEEIPEDKIESDDEPEEELGTDEKKDFPYERPTVKQIEKEFPEFFKKFPSMKDVYFREKEFTSLFPTVELAKDAQEAATALNDFRSDLFTGNGELFTSALKEAGELDKFSRNFLSNLQKSDKDSYWTAITPTLENLVRGFYRDGVKRGDKNVQLSAENLSIYLFDTAEVAEGKKTFIKEEPKPDSKLEREKQDFAREKFKDFNINVQEGCFTGIKDIIALDKIENLSATAQKLLLKEIIAEVDNQITKDTSHMTFVNSLWQKTKNSGYTSDLKSRIISAYLERAKSLVPSIRRRLLADVLGTSPEESRRKRDIVERAQSRKEPGSSGRPVSGSQTRTPSAKSIDWNKTSDMDFLNDNTTLKKGR